jgi:hypothetical protein
MADGYIISETLRLSKKAAVNGISKQAHSLASPQKKSWQRNTGGMKDKCRAMTEGDNRVKTKGRWWKIGTSATSSNTNYR